MRESCGGRRPHAQDAGIGYRWACATIVRRLARRAVPPARSIIEQHKKRVVENEILFRDVNERLKGVSEGFADVLPEFDIICECGDAGCTQRISVTLEEYEDLRAVATHFAIRRGHEALDIETIVEDRGGYLVVRKDPGRARELARETDPRGAS